MMKSYSESGGTTLSTNWDEVKKEKVTVKPPAGAEWKNWEGETKVRGD
jgi:suppressor of G2 allele of SKP1